MQPWLLAILGASGWVAAIVQTIMVRVNYREKRLQIEKLEAEIKKLKQAGHDVIVLPSPDQVVLYGRFSADLTRWRPLVLFFAIGLFGAVFTWKSTSRDVQDLRDAIAIAQEAQEARGAVAEQLRQVTEQLRQVTDSIDRRFTESLVGRASIADFRTLGVTNSEVHIEVQARYDICNQSARISIHVAPVEVEKLLFRGEIVVDLLDDTGSSLGMYAWSSFRLLEGGVFDIAGITPGAWARFNAVRFEYRGRPSDLNRAIQFRVPMNLDQ